MDRNDERAAGSIVPDGAIHAHDPRVDALDRHAEERDRLFIWALYGEALGELERKRGHGRSAGHWVAVDPNEYIFFVRFLLGSIATVAVVVMLIKLGIDVVAAVV
jgi:hypothetical protein